MRLALDPRARRLLRRLPQNTVYTAMELVLLSLLALQCARLVWTIATPVNPIGNWQADSALRPAQAQPTTLLAEFDPFFRLSDTSAAPVAVTALDIKLFGTREDRASGRGSAIIGTADGQQRSYAVGDEITPGVILTGVGFDYVTISRNGTTEQLYLDQSPPADTVAPTSGSEDDDGPGGGSVNFAPPPAAPPSPPKTVAPPADGASAAQALAREARFQPRMNGGRVTGVTIQPQGDGAALRAAGLEAGDVILSVNGRRITSPAQAGSIAGQLGGAREVPVQVERDGRVMTVRVRPGQ